MAEPQMYMPRKYEHTTSLRAIYIEGWQDGLAFKDHAYLGNEKGAELVVREGAAALQAYTDGFTAAVDRRE